LNGIIAQLEQQKTAIERALTALREVGGTQAPAASPAIAATRKGRPKGTGLNRRSEGQKKRWAAKKVAESAAVAVPQKPEPRKPRFTPEGRQRLAEAMKQRWAVKRAATVAKKAARKKRKKQAAAKAA
jgi:hypothetical protein